MTDYFRWTLGNVFRMMKHGDYFMWAICGTRIYYHSIDKRLCGYRELQIGAWFGVVKLRFWYGDWLPELKVFPYDD